MTGAAGFAGSHLLGHLSTPGDVAGWARAEPPAELAELARWEQVDLLARDGRARSDAGAAARDGLPLRRGAAGGAIVDSRRRALEGNVLGTHGCWTRCVSRPAGACLVTGSATVYAPRTSPWAKTDVGPSPVPMRSSKLAQEALALRAAPRGRPRGRRHALLQPHGRPSGAAFVAPSIARQMASIECGAIGAVDSRRQPRAEAGYHRCPRHGARVRR